MKPTPRSALAGTGRPREPFYPFMPREGNEGTGDVAAPILKTFYNPLKNRKPEVSGGIFKLPNVKNYALTKYGQPAYAQIEAGLNYRFPGNFKRLDGAALLIRKENRGATYANDRYVYNKVT